MAEQQIYSGRLLENPSGVYTRCELLVGQVELTLKFPSDALRHHKLLQYDCFNFSGDYDNQSITPEHITPTERVSDLLKEIEDWDPSEMERVTKGL